jgi:hypothetical protein
MSLDIEEQNEVQFYLRELQDIKERTHDILKQSRI